MKKLPIFPVVTPTHRHLHSPPNTINSVLKSVPHEDLEEIDLSLLQLRNIKKQK